MASPASCADVPSDYAFVHYVVVALTLEASDWLVFALGYQHFLVAYDEAIENRLVCAIWVRESDNHMAHHLVWVSLLRGLGPSALADEFIR